MLIINSWNFIICLFHIKKINLLLTVQLNRRVRVFKVSSTSHTYNNSRVYPKNIYLKFLFKKSLKGLLIYFRINNLHYTFHALNIYPEIQNRQLKLSSTSHPFLWWWKKIITCRWHKTCSPQWLQWGNIQIKLIFFIWPQKMEKTLDLSSTSHVLYVTLYNVRISKLTKFRISFFNLV